jgi:hypothetical protein
MAWMALVLAVVATGSARADVYKYVDGTGKVHFTDVPLKGGNVRLEWKRPAAKFIDESKKKLISSGRVEAPPARRKAAQPLASLTPLASIRAGPPNCCAVIRTESV